MPAFTSRYSVSVTLAAGVTTTVDVPVDGARDWLFVVKNTGDEAITAMTLARYPLGVGELGEDAVSVTEDIPLAAGASTPIEGSSEPITTLRVVLTSTSGTTARIAGGGW